MRSGAPGNGLASDRPVDDWPRHPDETNPAEYKTACDGTGGLIRVRFVDSPHAGRSLYMDELDLPEVIYTTASNRSFEWWNEQTHELMRNLPAGTDPDAPPVRHQLRVDDQTRQPTFVAVHGASPGEPGETA
jgi:hypothetical protein